MWLRRLAAIALFSASGFAAAAGISCDKAANSVDQAICRSKALPALDAQMGQAYADASQRAGAAQDTLLRDQRHWLAERNELIRALLGDTPTKSSDEERPVVRFYQERIAYLGHVFRNEPGSAPLLVAIADKLSKDESHGYASDVWKPLGGDGSIFVVPKEQETDAKHAASMIPVDPGKSLTDVIKVLDNDGDTSQITLVMLPELGTGGLYQMAGTLHCVDWSLFTWHGRAIKALDTPDILQQNCWTTWGTLVAFQGKVQALTNGRDLTSDSIQTQALANGKWGAPAHLVVRYDYELTSPQGHCAKDNPDCAELTALASGYVTRYDRSRIPEVLTSALLQDKEKARYAAMQKAVHDDQYTPLPAFDQPDEGNYENFGDGAITFPVHWHGELLLGRIGRASMGWRIGDDWLVALWRQDGQKLTPLVGVRVPVVRSGYLHSALVP